MRITKWIETYLYEENKLTKKELHAKLQEQGFTHSYQWFNSKFKEDNLSAVELVQIASILDLNLNELVAMWNVENQQNQESQTSHDSKDFYLLNSIFAEKGTARVVLFEDGSGKVVTWNREDDSFFVEGFWQNGRNIKFVAECVINQGFKQILTAHGLTWDLFNRLLNEEKTDFAMDVEYRYMSLFPEKKTEWEKVNREVSNPFIPQGQFCRSCAYYICSESDSYDENEGFIEGTVMCMKHSTYPEQESWCNKFITWEEAEKDMDSHPLIFGTKEEREQRQRERLEWEKQQKEKAQLEKQDDNDSIDISDDELLY